MRRYYQIRVKGIVQGVGFRPFIYQLAHEHDINGSVINDTAGVFIEAEGDEQNLNSFIRDIELQAPPLSHITSLEKQEGERKGFHRFSIDKSRDAGERMVFYSPDIAVCTQCLDEFFDTHDRRYHYPFITCINCGPRFSIVRDIPYDRPFTAMDVFPMCEQCNEEYQNAQDRRFHTQPNACHDCGPHMFLHSADGTVLSEDIETVAGKTVELLKQGRIGALKGVGGYHLAVDALNSNAVTELRRRKKRPFKPFALMAGSLEVVEEFLEVSEPEKDLLVSKERPIVLLKEKSRKVSREVAPGISWHGIMLPYTPFHHLLFSLEPNMILVMTSGNLSDEPIVYRDDEAFLRLRAFADFFVSYNREIIAPNDDSVLFVELGKPLLIRRSRGYIPIPFPSKKNTRNILAVGGDLKNSFAVARNEYVIMSQYLGDMADAMTHRTFKQTVDHFVRIFNSFPDVIVSDLHPGYITTLFADEFASNKIERIKVQHHHAHIASVIEEKDIQGDVIGIAFDGTGYGTDGTLWGSEFLIVNRKDFIRAGHFKNFTLPGGESAIKDVWKIGLSLLFQSYGDSFPVFKKDATSSIIIDMIKKGINSPQTCSIGRLFDGISSILGISNSVTSEAEAAMLLEEAAQRGRPEPEPYLIPWSGSDTLIIDTEDLVRYVVSLLQSGMDIDDIAAAFHRSLSLTTLAVVQELRKEYGINKVVLSGGVFHNRILLKEIYTYLRDGEFELFIPSKVPVNDGCIK